MKPTLRRAMIASMGCVLAACSATSQSGVTPINHSPLKQGDNASEQPSEASGGSPSGGSGVDPNSVVPAGASILTANYNVNATALGMTMCQGALQMQMNANFGNASQGAQMFNIPEGVVNCTLVGQINLAQMLGAYSQNPPPNVANPVTVDPDPNCPMIELAVLAQGTYSPDRPLLPSFISGDPTALSKMDCTRTVTLTDHSTNKTGTGTVRVHMLKWHETYSPPGMQRQFNNVFDVEIINNFDANQVDLVPNVLFDRMEFRISLDPIAILYIQFTGKASDLAAAQGALSAGQGGSTAGASTAGSTGGTTGGLGGLLGGGTSGSTAGGGVLGSIVGAVTKLIDVNMTMDLTAQQGLDTSAAATTSDSSNSDGEVIDGKPAGSAPSGQ